MSNVDYDELLKSVFKILFIGAIAYLILIEKTGRS